VLIFNKRGFRIVARFAVFLGFLGLWTWKLLESDPSLFGWDIPLDLRFGLAKGLHAGAYTFLTVLAVALPVRRRYFWIAILTLALHGVVMEIAQLYVPNRNGSVRDVLINWTGIGFGLLVLRLTRRRSKAHLPLSDARERHPDD
jgi:hypothetical protein